MAKKLKGKILLPYAMEPFENGTKRILIYPISQRDIKAGLLPDVFDDMLDGFLDSEQRTVKTPDGLLEYAYDLNISRNNPKLERIVDGIYLPKFHNAKLSDWDISNLMTYGHNGILFKYFTDSPVGEGLQQREEILYAGVFKSIDSSQRLLNVTFGDEEKSFLLSSIRGVDKRHSAVPSFFARLQVTFTHTEGLASVEWDFLDYESRIVVPTTAPEQSAIEPELMQDLHTLKGKKVAISYPQGAQQLTMTIRLIGYSYRRKTRRLTLHGEGGISLSGDYEQLKLKEYREDVPKRKIFGLR